MHIARHDAAATRVRVALVPPDALLLVPRPRDPRGARGRLLHAARVRAAGGSSARGGIQRASVPFDGPWGSRARLRARPGAPTWGSRHATSLPAQPPGDLLQAGPLLVRDGARDLRPPRRPGGVLRRLLAVRLRHHRRAPPARGPGLTGDDEVLAVACDGRSPRRRRGSRSRSSRPSLVGLGVAQRHQPRRRRVHLARRRRPPPQPPLRRPGPPGAGRAARRDGARLRDLPGAGEGARTPDAPVLQIGCSTN